MSEHHAGKRQREKGMETRQRIKEWFFENPMLTAKQCALDLGLTDATVSRHVQILRAEAVKARSKNNG